MRNILIPTDFTVKSLQLVTKTLEALDQQPTNIILFHAFDINTQSPDLLLSSRRLPYADVLTDEFRNGCRKIKTAHCRYVNQVNIRHMFGSTVAVFRNFIDANDIDMIIYPNDYVFQKVTPQSIDPEKLFRKSGIPVLHPVVRKTTIIQPSSAPHAETLSVLVG